jgi:hypothetical protein
MIPGRRFDFACGLLLLLLCPFCRAQQQPSLPVVNLGDTSFLDGIAFPGWLVEDIGQGEHDNKTLSDTGRRVPGITDANSGASLLHIAWLAPHARLLGAWYGTEVVLSGAYVNTGGHGIGQGVGDFTFAPIILQWPKHTLFGMPIYQRATFDIDAPIGRYSRDRPVNIGNNAWALNPYYAVTSIPLSVSRQAGASTISGMPPTMRRPSTPATTPPRPARPSTSTPLPLTRFSRVSTSARTATT